ncbi:hypothetical protein ACQPUZ_00410 [Clostridium tertium]|uniref:hypothetical protein n=1 Tax=Clostridium nigeriense TaxID=1805470 RepID=UPI003D32E122
MSKELLTNKEEEIISFKDEVSFLDPRSKKEFLTVMKVENEEINNKKCIGSLAKVNMFMQQLPLAVSIEQSEIISNSYKIVFPEGASGTLMKYKNGMLGTPLIGDNGKISAHAGLVSVDNISLTPLMIFSAMSAITGQYFMARIDEGLETITKNVKEIIGIIYDEKESDNFSAYNFCEYVKSNMQLILGNEVLKLSTLTNLQATNNKMCSNILFYSKSIDRKSNDIVNIPNKKLSTTDKRLSEMDELSKIVFGLIRQQQLSFELLCIGKVYEIQVAEMYDEEYYKNIIAELERVGNIVDSDVKMLIDKCEETLLEIIKKAIKGDDAVSQFKKAMQDYKNKQLEFEKIKNNFIENIISFKDENIKAKEFVVVDDLIYA